MSKNDNPHFLRMMEAIRTIHDNDAADAFAASFPLSKSADADKKFHWACEVCTFLDVHYTPEDAAQIRRACRCGDGKTMAREIAGCIRKAGNLSDGCNLFSQKNKYAFLEYVSEHELVFGYYACVCSCVKHGNGTFPRLWCECSVGYAEEMFRHVFGSAVQVTSIDAVHLGCGRCTFKVVW